MATILDYLDWRGDLSFSDSPFNEVDNLILTQIAFVDLEGIVPEELKAGFVSLAEAAARYFANEAKTKVGLGLIMPDDILSPSGRDPPLSRDRAGRLCESHRHRGREAVLGGDGEAG